MDNYIADIENNPNIILDHKFFIKYPDTDYEVIKNIISKKGIEHPELGFTFTVLPVFPIDKADDSDIVTFLYETQHNALLYWEQRSNYVLFKIGHTKRLENIFTLILQNNYDIDHPFVSFLISEYTYFSSEYIAKLADQYNLLLNSKAFYIYKDDGYIDKQFILKHIQKIIPENIPEKLRTNEILSMFVYGYAHDQLGDSQKYYTPINKLNDMDDFPMPDFDNIDINNDQDGDWLNTIQYWQDQKNSNIMEMNEKEIWELYKNDKIDFINKIKNNTEFTKKYLSISLIYKIIKDSPNIAILIPGKYLDIRHYVAIIKKNPKLIKKVPLLLQKSIVFRELCGEKFI